MKLPTSFLLLTAFLTFGIASKGMTINAPLPKPRQMEKLGRGVVAVQFEAGKVFVGWRVLGTDPANVAFNLYRSANRQKPVKLNQHPLVSASSMVDEQADLKVPNSYFVRPIINGRELAASASFSLAANAPVRQYLSIPLKTLEGYGPNDASVGDLNGDGEYEIVVHQVGRGRDNSQAGTTTEPILEAYTLDGTLLWRINLGKNIREGAHYTQFMVYDLDGDGIAEVACKTADGTIDGVGKVIGDPKADYREPEGAVITYKNARTGNEEKHNVTGYVLSGPEYLTIFDGRTGAALATTNFVPPRHPSSLKPSGDELTALWADGYGNRVDRFLACIAYLDGVRPSLVMARGYYTRTVLTAWDWRNEKLTQRWTFDSDSSPENRKFRGQGNHNLSVADVDMDGRDEIVYGAAVFDDNGTGLYSTGLGHGDALHVTDLDPDRPGLEVFDIQERFDDAGASFRDARTGEILWKKASVQAGSDGEGPGRGLALDIDPAHRGYESWVRGAGVVGLWNAKGEKISDKTPMSCNFGVWWDGDLLSELLDRNTISKWNPSNQTETVLLRDAACTSNNGTKATPTLSGDILGDWREEVIWRTTDNKELRIYTTVIPTKYRFYTLMHDPQYRLSIAWQNVAYNQPPHTGFYLGDGMAQPPKPNIVLVEPKRH